MRFYLSIMMIIFIILIDCRKQPNSHNSSNVTTLLKVAEDATYPIEERIDSALKADSITVLQSNKRTHLNCLRLISTLYLQQHNTLLAKSYFFKTINVAKSLADDTSLAVSFNNLGLIFSAETHYDSSLKYYNEAQHLFRIVGKKEWIAQSLIDLGIVYENTGNFEEAFKINLEAARIFETLNDGKDLASAYLNMGCLLKKLNRYDEALSYHFMALKIFKDNHDSSGIAVCFNNIGNIYRYKKEYLEALSNYFSAMEIKKTKGNIQSIATTIDNIGQVYLELEDFSRAQANFKKALELRDQCGDKDGFLTTSNRLSRLYLKINAIENAEAVALKAFNIIGQSGSLKERLENNLVLFEIYKRLGKYNLASDFASKGFELKDSLFNSDMAKAVSQMSIKYKTGEKEKELQLSKQLQRVQSNQIRTQLIFISLLIFFLLLLSTLVFLLYRSNRIIKQANQRIEILLKELNHRVKNNLQIVSDMLHLQMQMTKDDQQIALVQSSINRVESMNIIHSMLYKKGYNGVIDVKGFIETLTANLAHTYKDKSAVFNTSVKITNSLLDIDKAIPLGLIINELITNIFKYGKTTRGNPFLQIKLTEENNFCKLEITDNCEPWDFRKIKTVSNGLGLFLVETLVNQIGGTWAVINNDYGTVQCIEFSK